MDHYRLYQPSIPECISECLKAPAMQRLMGVGMNCGCEYTSFPRFRGLDPYSRYDHSVGVALIVWHFTGDPKQAIAGLLHDVATPVFAHVVDFLRGDYLQQEATEAGTEEIIAGSPQIQTVLKQHGLTTADVCDYHMYPVADNDSPRLSADRLEYTLGNLLNYRICTGEQVKAFYRDLYVGLGDDGKDELMFHTEEIAEAFAEAALSCSKIYVSDEDRYAMQILSEILRQGIDLCVITEEDLYTTEEAVITKLLQNEKTAEAWKHFCAYGQIIRGSKDECPGAWRLVQAKKRCIDPMVDGKQRVSRISSAFAESLQEFLSADQNYWICGKARVEIPTRSYKVRNE